MHLIVKMTDACNFACQYCSVGDPKQTSRIELSYIKKFIDGCQELLEYKKDDWLTVLWHGGEPLMIGTDVYTELHEYILKKLPNTKIKFNIQTNGSLINAQWIDFFEKYGICPGISLDGYKELHDVNRVDKEGKQTFDTVMKNIALLRSRGIEPGILMVLNTHENIDVDKLYDFLVDNKFNTKIHAVFPAGKASGRHDLDMLFKKYVDILIALFKKAMRDNKLYLIDPVYSLFSSIINDRSMTECSYSGNCGRDFICLYEDGNVSFCGRNDSTQALLYGNIKDKTPLDLYLSEQGQRLRGRVEAVKERGCGNCKYFKLCHGGCPFEALLHTDEIESKYVHCAEWKRLLAFMYNEGLDFFREQLLMRKSKIKMDISEKEEILKEYINNV